MEREKSGSQRWISIAGSVMLVAGSWDTLLASCEQTCAEHEKTKQSAGSIMQLC